MNKMNLLIVYFISLFAIVWAVIMIKKRVVKNVAGNRGEYDERQLVARGMAYKYAFFTAIIYFAVNAFVVSYLGYQWCTYEINIAIGIGITVIVFAAVCIWKDAYVSVGMSATYYYGLLVIIGALNMFIGTKSDNFPEAQVVNDQIKNISMNLVCGITLIVVALIGLIKHTLSRREEE